MRCKRRERRRKMGGQYLFQFTFEFFKWIKCDEYTNCLMLNILLLHFQFFFEISTIKIFEWKYVFVIVICQQYHLFFMHLHQIISFSLLPFKFCCALFCLHWTFVYSLKRRKEEKEGKLKNRKKMICLFIFLTF